MAALSCRMGQYVRPKGEYALTASLLGYMTRIDSERLAGMDCGDVAVPDPELL
ncbi:MAG: hypothetical protein PF636_04200 [Actinomycetota bacterium]|nr:hypothetical protein [Actinomycetota bacterium]